MRRTAATLAMLMVLAACAGPPGTPPPSASPGGSGHIDHPDGAAAVLVMRMTGGFVPAEFNLRNMPSFVMLGDGRVFRQGAVDAMFPGPAVMPIEVRRLDEAGVQRVLEAVEQTGLFTRDLDLRGAAAMVADASDTVFELSAAGRNVTVSVYALGMVSQETGLPPGMSSAELEAHRRLAALASALTAIDDAVPAGEWLDAGWQAWQPEALRLYVRDVSAEPPPADLAPEVVDWPTDGDPSKFGDEVALLGDGTRCGVVAGADAVAWWVALGKVRELARWTKDGEHRYSVVVRPLLPNEDASCPDR